MGWDDTYPDRPDLDRPDPIGKMLRIRADPDPDLQHWSPTLVTNSGLNCNLNFIAGSKGGGSGAIETDPA